MTKFNAEKYEQFLENANTISSDEPEESYDFSMIKVNFKKCKSTSKGLD